MKFGDNKLTAKATLAWQGAWDAQKPEVLPVLAEGVNKKDWLKSQGKDNSYNPLAV